MLRSVSRFAGSIGAVTAMGLLLTQIDKVVLSRLVSLETLGFYMLAWTVASGLSRVTAPLLSAFGPHFTELVATGSTAALASRLRLASQLTNALVLPPAALLVLLAYPVLLAWIGNPAVATGSAPLLRVITIGTLLAACAYPALGVVYATRRLRPVIAVNLAAVIVLLPMIVAAVAWYGALGASFCWALYGLTLYISYQAIGRHGLPDGNVLVATARDFMLPALASLVVAVVMLQGSQRVEGRPAVAAIVSVGLLAGWAAAAMVCGDLRAVAIAMIRRHTLSVSGSA
jgi:O-antigen/teichoic acid export membrane protein